MRFALRLALVVSFSWLAAACSGPLEHDERMSGSGREPLGSTGAPDAGAARAPDAGPARDPGFIPPPPGGSYKPAKPSQGDIMGVVVGYKGAIKGCIEKYKASGGDKGTLVMLWTIQPDGRTSGVKPKGTEHALLASCLGGLIEGWTFPESEQGAPIEFPFTF